MDGACNKGVNFDIHASKDGIIFLWNIFLKFGQPHFSEEVQPSGYSMEGVCKNASEMLVAPRISE